MSRASEIQARKRKFAQISEDVKPASACKCEQPYQPVDWMKLCDQLYQSKVKPYLKLKEEDPILDEWKQIQINGNVVQIARRLQEAGHGDYDQDVQFVELVALFYPIVELAKKKEGLIFQRVDCFIEEYLGKARSINNFRFWDVFFNFCTANGPRSATIISQVVYQSLNLKAHETTYRNNLKRMEGVLKTWCQVNGNRLPFYQNQSRTKTKWWDWNVRMFKADVTKGFDMEGILACVEALSRYYCLILDIKPDGTLGEDEFTVDIIHKKQRYSLVLFNEYFSTSKRKALLHQVTPIASDCCGLITEYLGSVFEMPSDQHGEFLKSLL